MTAPALTICEFVDPGCPFLFCNEPNRQRLRWLYGDQIEWELRVIGLTREDGEYERKGSSVELQAAGARRLAEQHGMPFEVHKPRMLVTGHACRAVVAVDRYRPDISRVYLRALMVAFHSHAHLIDELEVLLAVGEQVGIDASALAEWISEGETGELLEAHYTAARTPTPAALAQPDRMATDLDGTVRYSAASMEICNPHTGVNFSLPGLQPMHSYEAAIANLAPDLERRAAPETVGEALAWAGTPLATAELAALVGRTTDDVRDELKAVAEFAEAGTDGYWSLVPITTASPA